MNKEEFEKKISPMGLDSLRELCITGRSFYKTYPLNVARYALEDIIKGGGHSLRDVPNYSEPMSPAKGIPPLVRYIQQTPDLYQSADFLAKEFFGEMPDQPLVGFHRLAQGWVRPEDTDSAEKIEVTDSTEKIEESLDNSIDDSTATEPEEGQEDAQEPAGDQETKEGSGSIPQDLLELLGELSGIIGDGGLEDDCDCAAHTAGGMIDYVEKVEYSIAHMNGVFDFEQALNGVRGEFEDGIRSALHGLVELKMVLARIRHTLVDSMD